MTSGDHAAEPGHEGASRDPSPAVLETTELDPQRVGVTKRISRLILRLWDSWEARPDNSESNITRCATVPRRLP